MAKGRLWILLGLVLLLVAAIISRRWSWYPFAPEPRRGDVLAGELRFAQRVTSPEIIASPDGWIVHGVETSIPAPESPNDVLQAGVNEYLLRDAAGKLVLWNHAKHESIRLAGTETIPVERHGFLLTRSSDDGEVAIGSLDPGTGNFVASWIGSRDYRLVAAGEQNGMLYLGLTRGTPQRDCRSLFRARGGEPREPVKHLLVKLAPGRQTELTELPFDCWTFANDFIRDTRILLVTPQSAQRTSLLDLSSEVAVYDLASHRLRAIGSVRDCIVSVPGPVESNIVDSDVRWLRQAELANPPQRLAMPPARQFFRGMAGCLTGALIEESEKLATYVEQLPFEDGE